MKIFRSYILKAGCVCVWGGGLCVCGWGVVRVWYRSGGHRNTRLTGTIRAAGSVGYNKRRFVRGGAIQGRENNQRNLLTKPTRQARHAVRQKEAGFLSADMGEGPNMFFGSWAGCDQICIAYRHTIRTASTFMTERKRRIACGS